jgi:hypothetical protein
MLICVPDHSLRLSCHYFDLDTHIQDTALAHVESGRLLPFRPVSLRPLTAWNRFIRVSLHVRTHGNEMVLDRAFFVCKRDPHFRGKLAGSLSYIFERHVN